jgi:hypothetical protein
MRADEILILDGLKKFEAEVAKKPSGAIIIDGMHVADTVRCVHCGHHWIPIAGSGITRGWCHHCGGALCGSKECFQCKDFRKKMDEYEKGKLKHL